jgi:hypothetical protein
MTIFCSNYENLFVQCSVKNLGGPTIKLITERFRKKQQKIIFNFENFVFGNNELLSSLGLS